MTLTYRTDGAWGTGKGGNLTPAEVDGNFFALVQMIASVADELVPAEIDSITVVGSQMTIILSDAREFGPFTLPRAAFQWRGDFAGSTSYLVNDVISAEGGVYLVLQSHTGVDPFDPERLIGGNPVYAQMLGAGGGGGGGTSQVVTLTSDSSAYTLDPDHNGAYVRATILGDIIIPAEASVSLPIGYTVRIRWAGGGQVIVDGESGDVTLNLPFGYENTIAFEGGVATLIKVGADEWDMFGDLEAS